MLQWRPWMEPHPRYHQASFRLLEAVHYCSANFYKFCLNCMSDPFSGIGSRVGNACAQVVLFYVDGWGTMPCH